MPDFKSAFNKAKVRDEVQKKKKLSFGVRPDHYVSGKAFTGNKDQNANTEAFSSQDSSDTGLPATDVKNQPSDEFIEQPHKHTNGISYQGFMPIKCSTFSPDLFQVLSPGEFKLFIYMSFLSWRYPARPGCIRAAINYLERGTGIRRSALKDNIKGLIQAKLIECVEVDMRLGNLYSVSNVLLHTPPEKNSAGTNSKYSQPNGKDEESAATKRKDPQSGKSQNYNAVLDKSPELKSLLEKKYSGYRLELEIKHISNFITGHRDDESVLLPILKHIALRSTDLRGKEIDSFAGYLKAVYDQEKQKYCSEQVKSEELSARKKYNDEILRRTYVAMGVQEEHSIAPDLIQAEIVREDGTESLNTLREEMLVLESQALGTEDEVECEKIFLEYEDKFRRLNQIISCMTEETSLSHLSFVIEEIERRNLLNQKILKINGLCNAKEFFELTLQEFEELWRPWINDEEHKTKNDFLKAFGPYLASTESVA